MVLINKAPVSSGKLFIFATGPSANIKRIISVDKTVSEWARICFIRLAQGEIDGATSQKLVGSLLRNILWQYNSIDFIAIIHDCANMKLSPSVYVRITGIYSSDLHSI